jgi:hypothetical protein
MLSYFAAKEAIFVFITYLIGKESPCYNETFSKQSDNWDYGRPYIHNYEPVVDLIFELFMNSSENRLSEVQNVSILFNPLANSTICKGYEMSQMSELLKANLQEPRENIFTPLVLS